MVRTVAAMLPGNGWSPSSTVRADTATRAPSAAKRSAMAAPMPRDAPVTSTTLPARLMPCPRAAPQPTGRPWLGEPRSSVVDPGGGVAGEDLFAVLVGGADDEVDQVLAVLLAHGLDHGGGRQVVTGPHLGGEPAAEAGQPAVADEVGEHVAGHAHGEHAVGEHARIAGDLGGEHLVGVDRVVVARGAGVLHDLRALEVLDDGGRELLALGELL